MADGYSTVIDARATSDRKWIMDAKLTNTGGMSGYLLVGDQMVSRPCFVTFDLVEEDGHMYAVMVESVLDDLTFALNEETGHLEVIYYV